MKNYSAILEMYRANRGTYNTLKPTEEEKTKLSEIVNLENKLLKELHNSPHLIKLYNNIDEAVVELNILNNESTYIEGFRFGFLIALDVFMDIKFKN